MPTLRLTSLGEVTLGVFNVHDLVMAVNELWPVVRILDVKRKVSSYEFLIAFLLAFLLACYLLPATRQKMHNGLARCDIVAVVSVFQRPSLLDMLQIGTINEEH